MSKTEKCKDTSAEGSDKAVANTAELKKNLMFDCLAACKNYDS